MRGKGERKEVVGDYGKEKRCKDRTGRNLFKSREGHWVKFRRRHGRGKEEEILDTDDLKTV